MADITMSLDDTLELDTIIEQSSDASNTVTVTDGTEGSDFESDGLQTKTYIFDPINSGTYNLDVNGQTLKVKVKYSNIVPNSAIHQWQHSKGSGSTINDKIGSADGSITEANWVSGDYVKDNALEGDGNGDYVTATINSFGSNLDTNWAILFTIETTDTGRILGSRHSGGNFELQISNTGRGGGSNNNIEVFLRDEDSNRLVEEGSTDITDGSKYRVVANKTGNSGDDIDIWINGIKESTNNVRDENFNKVKDFDQDLGWFCQWDGSPLVEINAIIDNIIFCDSDLSSQEINSDYESQPWS